MIPTVARRFRGPVSHAYAYHPGPTAHSQKVYTATLDILPSVLRCEKLRFHSFGSALNLSNFFVNSVQILSLQLAFSLTDIFLPSSALAGLQCN